jgi:FlaA1/EpsC-like NDP-sugar epimerase
LQEVDIADLLGRDSVPAQPDLLERLHQRQDRDGDGRGWVDWLGAVPTDFRVGSDQRLLLFDHSEFNLYSILSELERRGCP